MSFRFHTSKYILDEFKEINAQYKILVLDSFTTKILDACTNMTALPNTGIFLIERIEAKRQKYSYMDGIYFVSPTKEAIEKICNDFEVKNTYKEAHILLTSPISPELYKKLTTSRASGWVQTFKILYTEYMAFEELAFQLDIPFYPSPADPFDMSLSTIQAVANRICGMCIVNKEAPLIRFSSWNGDAGISKKLAEHVFKGIEAHKSEDGRFPAATETTLLIVDRRIDLLSPLMHEFTYQAMVHDLLPIKDENRYNTGKKTVALDSDDSMWCSLRHTHIAECTEEIKTRFQKFTKENKAAAAEKDDGGNKPSLAEMKDTIAALPKYHELKNAFSLHMSIAAECVRVFNERGLNECGLFEQDLATGMNIENKKTTCGLNEITAFLSSSKLLAMDKERLLLIYANYAENVNEEEVSAVCRNLSMEQSIIKIFQYIRQKRIKIQRPTKKDSGNKFSLFSKNKKEEPKFDISRYVPKAAGIFEDLADNTLDEEMFKYVSPDDPRRNKTQEKPLSLRKTEASQAGTSKKYIVFFTGGIAYSELREAYKVSEKKNCNIVIGGSCVLTPAAFLGILHQNP